MNRFFDVVGDFSVQLAPWELQRRGKGLSPALFELCTPIRFRSDVLGGVIVVPAGYLSDLASIPQFAWSAFMASDDPRIELGAWVHDILYARAGTIRLEDGRAIQATRKQADTLLAYEAMPDLQASPAQQWAVYQAVRRFGPGWPQEPKSERFT